MVAAWDKRAVTGNSERTETRLVVVVMVVESQKKKDEGVLDDVSLPQKWFGRASGLLRCYLYNVLFPLTRQEIAQSLREIQQRDYSI